MPTALAGMTSGHSSRFMDDVTIGVGLGNFAPASLTTANMQALMLQGIDRKAFSYDLLASEFKKRQNENDLILEADLNVLFTAVGLGGINEDDIGHYLNQVRGDDDDQIYGELDLESVQKMVEMILTDENNNRAAYAEDMQKQAELPPPSFWNRVSQLFRCKTGKAAEIKPSTALTVLAIGVAVVTLTVGTTAVGVNFTWGLGMSEDNIGTIAKTVADVADTVSRVGTLEAMKDSLFDSVLAIGTFVEALGYNMTATSRGSELLNELHIVTRAMNNTIDSSMQLRWQSLTDQLMLVCSFSQWMDLAQLVATVDQLNGLAPSPVNITTFRDRAEILVMQPNATYFGGYIYLNSVNSFKECAPLCNFGLFQNPMADALTPQNRLSAKVSLATTFDYRNVQIMAAAKYIPAMDVVVVIKMDMTVVTNKLRTDFVTTFNDMNDNNNNDSSRFGLAIRDASSIIYIQTDLPNCTIPTGCTPPSGLSTGHRNAWRTTGAKEGWAVGKNFDGDSVLVAWSFYARLNVSLVLEQYQAEVKSKALANVVQAANIANDRLPGSTEVVLGTKGDGSGRKVIGGVSILTDPKMPEGCIGECYGTAESSSLMVTALDGKSGVIEGVDYRPEPVLGARMYLSTLSAGMVLKIDRREVYDNLTKAVVAFVDTFNNRSQSLATSEVILVQKDARYTTGYRTLSRLRETVATDDEDCTVFNCTTVVSPAMLAAASGVSRIMTSSDYRGTQVIAGTSYMPTLGLGLEYKVDQEEIMLPLWSQLGLVAGMVVGLTAAGITAMFILVKRLLRSSDEKWQAGLDLLRNEKSKFETLLSAMLPKHIAARLVAGESTVSMQIQQLTFIFADIVNFTKKTRTMTASELVSFLRYVFHLFDATAEQYSVHKIKTIGDCYFAVSGLPEEGDVGSQVERMMQFASSIIQMFAGRFQHLDPVGNVVDSFNLRVGLNTGPAVIGVIGNKTPQFDCWGPAVNLAARMESTGVAGGIHCTQRVYDEIMNSSAKHSWTFDAATAVFCKGFGTVKTFFVAETLHCPHVDLTNDLLLNRLNSAFRFPLPRKGGAAGGTVIESDRNSHSTSHRSRPVAVREVSLGITGMTPPPAMYTQSLEGPTTPKSTRSAKSDDAVVTHNATTPAIPPARDRTGSVSEKDKTVLRALETYYKGIQSPNLVSPPPSRLQKISSTAGNLVYRLTNGEGPQPYSPLGADPPSGNSFERVNEAELSNLMHGSGDSVSSTT